MSAAVQKQLDDALKALQRIADWKECDATFRADYGSNGERDYYRQIARDAIAVQSTHSADVSKTGAEIDLLKQAEGAIRGLLTWGTDENYVMAAAAVKIGKTALSALEFTQKRQGWPVAVVDYSALGNIRWSFGPQAPDGTVLYAAPQPLREMNADELRGLMPEPYRTTDRHISAPITRNVLFEPGSYFTTDQLIAAMRAARSAK